jgi:hypothetical protein
MKTFIALALALVTTNTFFTHSHAAKSFRLVCYGENNNDLDPVVQGTIDITLQGKTIKAGAEKRTAAKLSSLSVRVYENRNSQDKEPVLTLSDLNGIGIHSEERADQNEDGRMDSTLNSFTFSFQHQGQLVEIMATNDGQGGKKDFALHLRHGYGKSEEGITAWGYCLSNR